MFGYGLGHMDQRQEFSSSDLGVSPKESEHHTLTAVLRKDFCLRIQVIVLPLYFSYPDENIKSNVF